MERLTIPRYEPCPNCANGNLLRDGQQVKCECWLTWWAAVRAAFAKEKR